MNPQRLITYLFRHQRVVLKSSHSRQILALIQRRNNAKSSVLFRPTKRNIAKRVDEQNVEFSSNAVHSETAPVTTEYAIEDGESLSTASFRETMHVLNALQDVKMMDDPEEAYRAAIEEKIPGILRRLEERKRGLAWLMNVLYGRTSGKFDRNHAHLRHVPFEVEGVLELYQRLLRNRGERCSPRFSM